MNEDKKAPKRIAQTLINSLKGGVVPRTGLPYITVGRKNEIEALLHDVDIVAEGGASFRFIVGKYGSGKSFLLQTIRNYVMDKGFIVADADLSPERRLQGTKGQGLATYRELIGNLSTKTKPEGGAITLLLDRWINNIQTDCIEKNGVLFTIKKDVESNINSEAIKEVLERIKSLEKRGDTPITLKNISEYYLRTPYGWGQLTINGLVGELWKYKLIDLQESKVLVTDENTATNLLTKLQNKNLEKIVISLREEIDPELIKKVNNLLKEIKTIKEDTGEITLDSPKEDLLEILKRKIGIAKSYKIECEHSKYPGKKELNDWIDLLDEIILSKDNAEKILKNFLGMEDELLKEYGKVDGVFDFFTSSKKERYDKAIEKINKIEEYKDYIGSLKETNAYKIIDEIRLDKNIYERIREFDDLISELDKGKDELIEIEKTSLKEKVEKYKKDFSEKLKDNPEIIKKLEEKLNEFLEKEVNNKDNSNDMAIFMKSKKLENIVNNFEEEYKNSAKKEIEKLENYLNEVAEDKTDIDELRKSIKSIYNNYKDEIAKSDIKNVSITIAKAIKDKEDFNAEINGKAKKKERIKLRKISINSKSNIESEEQVKEYILAIEKDIEKLKNEMLEAIKNNKIVDIG